MKLNKDCVRGILLAVEDWTDETQKITADSLASNELLENYSVDEIRYAIARLSEAGFLDVINIRMVRIGTDYIVNSLTWYGHEFLDNIRDNTVWNEVKEKTSKLSSVSLNILSDLGSKIASKFIGLD